MTHLALALLLALTLELGPKPGRGRTSRRWQRMRAEVKARRGPCVYCLGEVDYDDEDGGPRSFTVAHRLPVSTHPDLAEEWSNIMGAAHRSCNSSAGNKGDAPVGLGLVSEEA